MACLLAASPAAHAISEPMSGYYLEVGGSLDVATTPFAVPVGGTVGLGWWRGKYDDAYALGRFFSLGPSVRFGAAPGGLRVTPMLEARKGYDLFVIKPWFGAAAGVELGPAGPGPTVRVGGGAKYRFSRFVGMHARADAGVAYVGGAVAGRFGLVVALDVSAPFRSVKR